MEKKTAAVLTVILILSATAVGYALYFPQKSRSKVTFALAIQPLPDGRIAVLGKGSMGEVLKAKPHNAEWEEYLKGDKNVLKSIPAPIVLYFTDDNRMGVGSLKNGKLVSKVEFSLKKLPRLPKKDIRTAESIAKGSVEITGGSSGCPKGYIPISDRYCIVNTTDPLLYGVGTKTKIVSEWIPFMGMAVYTYGSPIYVISPSWGIILDDTAVATYTLDVAGISIVTLGNEYSGRKLKVGYGPEGRGLLTSNGYIERYINLPLKYLIFTAELLGYDRYTHEYVYIPMTGTYPIEIQLTGEYTLTDDQYLNKQVLSSTGLPGYLLTDYRIESYFPKDAGEKVKVINVGPEGYYSNVVFEFQGGSSYYFYSAPIGGIAQDWLSQVLGLSDSPVPVSLTISYSEGATSFITYSLDIIRATPNTEYEVKIKERDVKLPSSGGEVELGMYFTDIEPAESTTVPLPPCFGGVCPYQDNTSSEK